MVVFIVRITKDPDVRKGELIMAAEELFRERGFGQTSVSDIVKSVGVAQGTFYYYFKSKGDVLDAVIECYLQNYCLAIEHLLGDDNIDPGQKIEIIARNALCMHRYNRKFVEFLHSEANLVTHQKFMIRSFNVVIPLVAAIVDQGIKAGMFDVRYPAETVEMLVYAFGYMEDSLQSAPEDEQFSRRIAAAEDMVNRTLGIRKGRRLKIDLGAEDDLLKGCMNLRRNASCSGN